MNAMLSQHSAPWSATHPITAEDKVAMLALRAMVEPLKGKLQGTAARPQFDAITERVTAPEGVSFEADTVGAIPGWWCRPRQAKSANVILHLHGGWFNWGSAQAFRHLVGHIAASAGANALAPKIASALRQLDVGLAEFILEKMPRVRYQMWNGRWHAAVRRMHEIYQAAKTGLKLESAGDIERLQRFRRHLFELKEYLRNNWKNLTNYAHAYRHGLRISSAPAESGMSHLVNQRMGKRQSMRWSAEGAHQLLQARCAVLDCRLEAFFRELHPKFRLSPPAERECCV
jgi:hypothetical protein